MPETKKVTKTEIFTVHKGFKHNISYIYFFDINNNI